MSSKNLRALSYRKGMDDNLFSNISKLALEEASEDEFKKVASDYHLGESVLLGTSSFYDFLRPENVKKKVHVCTGTACMTAGTQEGLRDNLKDHFGDDEVGHAACLGHCHTNSAFMYNDKTYSVSDVEELSDVVNSKSTKENKYSTGSNTIPILSESIREITAFYSLLKNWVDDKERIIKNLKASNLRGRGGAGFPFFFKLDSASKVDQEQKYIVCNADEGDPGAYSDMYLMEQQAHKVLFGMMAAGLVIGADTGVLYIRGEYPNSIRKIEEAINELSVRNLVGENILGIEGFNFNFKITRGQGAYVCGEETALLNSIEGLRPEVRVRPPYPTVEGLYGKPTVLSNVETFANIHWILENGGDAYAKLGTEKSKGTKLVSLDGFFNNPGVFEIEMGTPLKTIFEEFGKGFKTEIKALQIGGPLGGIVPIDKINDLTLDFESLGENGFLLGHASFVSIPVDFPMIKFIDHLMKFTADESCGKCYPCRIGSKRGHELLVKAQKEDFKIDRKLFDDLLETLEIGSLCALGGGIPLPLNNAMEYFEDELKQYFN
ncbi:MAG: NAD(P)H-dependent oxidoreductase subunit E [Flavobacteriales bacterium]|nr:NAD(P)H-dependent oxidoreductase subunit E [Flavobacteriales bacterium]